MFVYLDGKSPLESVFKFVPNKGSFTGEFLETYKDVLLGFENSDLVRNFLGFSIEHIWFDKKDIKKLIVSTYRDIPCEKEEYVSSHNLDLLLVYDQKEKIFILSEPEYYLDTTDETDERNGKFIEDEILEKKYLKFKEKWNKLTSEQIYNKLKECLLPVDDKDLVYKEINELRKRVVKTVEEKLSLYIKKHNNKENVSSYFQKALKRGLNLFSVEYYPINDRTPNETVLITINGLKDTNDSDCNHERFEISKEVSRELTSELKHIQRVIVCL